jgi:hypothetical protein
MSDRVAAKLCGFGFTAVRGLTAASGLPPRGTFKEASWREALASGLPRRLVGIAAFEY